jgi:hypothetical protein
MPPPEPPIAAVPVSFGLRSFSSRIAASLLALIALTGIAQWLRRAFCITHHGVDYSESARAGCRDSSRLGLREVPDDDNTWSVHIKLGDQDFEVPLPQSVASNTLELRQALAELASEMLGVERVPAAWMRDQFATMRVLYSDPNGRDVPMHDNTKIRAVYASRTLVVSMVR